MSHDPLDYPVLLLDALRHLVRRCLEIVVEQGLPGDHHFYLSFRTRAPGVVLPAHLLESYPEEMTIVLKTQFWDLFVDEDGFSVGLRFAGVLHHLTIPFAALLSFTDPSANFQLVFQAVPEAAGEMAEVEAPEAEAPGAMAPAAGDAGGGEPGEDEPATAKADNVVSFSGFRKKR